MNQRKILRVGHTAFNFALPDANGKYWRIHEQRGRVVALLFYPADETLVCTKQLCAVRDNWEEYVKTGAEVVAISPNDAAEHLNFAQRHSLPMPLLIDKDRIITRLFGSHWLFPIWATRAVVVVDAKGIVRYQNILLRALRPSDDEVLTAIHLAQYDDLVERRNTVSQRFKFI